MARKNRESWLQNLRAIEQLLAIGQEAQATAEDLAAEAEASEDGSVSEEEAAHFRAQLEEIARLQAQAFRKSAEAKGAIRRLLNGGDVEVGSYERGGRTVSGYSRRRRGGKSWPGSPEIVGAFARDPVEPHEAERMWDDFVRWAEGFGGEPGDSARDYALAARDDFDLLVPMGRGHIERGLAGYRQYIEDNFPPLKSARPTTARKGDGRDYGGEIDAAREALRDLRSRAEAIVESDVGPKEIQSQLAEISGEVSRLRLRIPVRDYNANDIPDGVDVDREATDLSIWLEEQYSRFRLNGNRPTTAHKLYA